MTPRAFCRLSLDGQESRWRRRDPDKKRPLGNKRVTGKEQFYTPPDTASQVVELVLRHFPNAVNQLWVEPAGGTGRFLDAFAAAGVTRTWSCDIEPHDPRVQQLDFLTLDPVEHLADAVVVTNPPFGRNNALSVPFFNKSAEFASVLAFIVPRSWRKWSITDRLDKRFHLVADEDIGVDYEDISGQKISTSGNLQTCVQVWERRDNARESIHVENRGYIAKADPVSADISLTVFGRGCGTVKTDFPRLPNTTQMFLNIRALSVLEALCSVDFSRFFRQVAYTEALSLREINYLLNEWFDAREAR